MITKYTKVTHNNITTIFYLAEIGGISTYQFGETLFFKDHPNAEDVESMMELQTAQALQYRNQEILGGVLIHPLLKLTTVQQSGLTFQTLWAVDGKRLHKVDAGSYGYSNYETEEEAQIAYKKLFMPMQYPLPQLLHERAMRQNNFSSYLDEMETYRKLALVYKKLEWKSSPHFCRVLGMQRGNHVLLGQSVEAQGKMICAVSEPYWNHKDQLVVMALEAWESGVPYTWLEMDAEAPVHIKDEAPKGYLWYSVESRTTDDLMYGNEYKLTAKIMLNGTDVDVTLTNDDEYRYFNACFSFCDIDEHPRLMEKLRYIKEGWEVSPEPEREDEYESEDDE